MSDPTHELVASGYDAVYDAMPRSPTLLRIWREHAMSAGYPDGFEHISFLTLSEMQRMARELRLSPGGHLVDLACGMGGPGLWIAREAGARLTGIDLSSVAVAKAAERAERVGMAQSATFASGSFDATGLDDASADAVMTIDALQYAPDKAAAFREFARILRPGGRLVFVAFALDPDRVSGVAVLGVDPVNDYAPLLKDAGFAVDAYEDTAGWRERLTAAYGACAAARETLVAEMGERAANALLFEMTMTLEREPYCGRPMVVAPRR